MNKDLEYLINTYATKNHTEVSSGLIAKSKDNLISMLMDLLTIYINDKNSSTLREFLTVNISGYKHSEANYAIMDDKKNSVIIDPYFGSGTTGIAAKLLGHNFIGIDASNIYQEMFNTRLQNIENKQEKFNIEIKKYFVNKTFKQRKENKAFTGKFNANLNSKSKKNEQLSLFL